MTNYSKKIFRPNENNGAISLGILYKNIVLPPYGLTERIRPVYGGTVKQIPMSAAAISQEMMNEKYLVWYRQEKCRKFWETLYKYYK